MALGNNIARSYEAVCSWLFYGTSDHFIVPFAPTQDFEASERGIEFYQDWLEPDPERGIDGGWGFPYLEFTASENRAFATCLPAGIKIDTDPLTAMQKGPLPGMVRAPDELSVKS